MTTCDCSGNYDLCIQQGALYERVFEWTEDPPSWEVAGAATSPVDLTGYTAALQIRPFPTSSDLLYDASDDVTLGGANGTITLEIPGSKTEGFTWWAGVYDLLLTSPSGFVTKLLSGGVSVCPGVTT